MVATMVAGTGAATLTYGSITADSSATSVSNLDWASSSDYTIRVDTTGSTYQADSTGAITIARNGLFEPYTIQTYATDSTASTNIQFAIRGETENGDIILGDNNYIYGGDIVWQDDLQFRENGNPRRRSLQVTEGPEEKARRLLHRMVGDRVFRDYLKNGFLSYLAKSGKVYQIMPGHAHMLVWKDGVQIEQLCVVFQNNSLPPTDAVIMRLLMLEHDEEGFRKMANVSRGFGSRERIRWTPPQAEKGRIVKLAEDKKKGLIQIQGSRIKRKAATGGYITAGTGSTNIIVAA